MDRTENDLCFDQVTLDYDALITVANTAFYKCIHEIEKHLHQLQQYPISKACYYLDAQRLEDTAKLLTVAAETKYTLENGLARPSKVRIVNKPEVEERTEDYLKGRR